MCRWVFLAPVCSRLWRSDVATAPICFRWTCVACFCLPPISFIILVTPSFPRLIPITFWYTVFTKIVICLADLLTLLIYLIFYMNPATWEINSEYVLYVFQDQEIPMNPSPNFLMNNQTSNLNDFAVRPRGGIADELPRPPVINRRTWATCFLPPLHMHFYFWSYQLF